MTSSENPFRGDIFVAGGISHRIGDLNVIDFGGIVAFFSATMLTKSQRPCLTKDAH
ncbi:MAG: hypothetical protein GYB55_00295 [Cytophagales bacterium]|uniref:hypothetical protein n=1 Tax=Cyclobacterium marinum TaxID=104 RepID=UPI0030DCE39B|nr:hypothetical protein [Cytophagales bacterium]